MKDFHHRVTTNFLRFCYIFYYSLSRFHVFLRFIYKIMKYNTPLAQLLERLK